IGYRQWPDGKLNAVLAHENEHVRRRDPLFQWLALLNRAVFWFHPLAWWLERRLAALSEEACDMAVIERGHDPREYCEYLLEMARSVMHAHKRLTILGTAMPGYLLPQRIRRILQGIQPSQVSRSRMTAAVVVCTVLSVSFATATPVKIQLAPADRAPQIFPTSNVS